MAPITGPTWGWFAGGTVKRGTNGGASLPYVEVSHIDEVTERVAGFG